MTSPRWKTSPVTRCGSTSRTSRWSAPDSPSTFPPPSPARKPPAPKPKAQTAKAAALIADTGYHRRDGELAELQARLAAPEPAH